MGFVGRLPRGLFFLLANWLGSILSDLAVL
jgi:hypothetical protein